MPRSSVNDMIAFLAVARDLSFTRASARLGVSPSALSHTIKALEQRLGIRLLSRTTRSVSLTEAGSRLALSVGPHVDQIESEIEALSELRDKPAGTIRLTCTDIVLDTMLRPQLIPFLKEYPDIKVETFIDYGMTDIVQDRFDAGIRLGESISKDMIAVRIGPDWRFSVVASPSYFADHPAPQTPQDLTSHNCINMRMPTSGTLYAWEFERDGRKLNVRVDGQMTFNSSMPRLTAALDGMGIAYVAEHLARPHIDTGALIEVLADWCPYFEGYHLYYPHRRQASSAFSLLVDRLRYVEP